MSRATTIRAAVIPLVLAMIGCAEEAVPPPPPREPPPGSILHGTFEGKTPCDDCTKIKIALRLFEQERDHLPTAYLLEWIGVGNSNERHVARGQWTKSVGIPIDADATVIELDLAVPQTMRSYVAFGDNLLLQLDENRAPRVGDAALSFTLSRTE